MKKLTQAVFENAPDWVKSAAVDENGEAFYFSVTKKDIEPFSGKIGKINHGYGFWVVKKDEVNMQLIGTGYDTTDWQHSALDKE